MAGRDRKLDPVTGDYLPDGKGGCLHVTTIETEVLHQQRERFNRWWGDRFSGSRLWELQTGNLDPATLALAKRWAELAMQGFIDSGRARDLRVSVVKDGQRISISTSMTDVQNGAQPVDAITPLESP